MKKLVILLFSVLFLTSVCCAEDVATAPGNQTKAAEKKEQGVSKKSVKPKVKKSGKKPQKRNKSTKKKEIAP